MACQYCADSNHAKYSKCGRCGEILVKNSNSISRRTTPTKRRYTIDEIGDLVLKIDDSFLLYSNLFINDGKIYDYADVTKLEHGASDLIINMATFGSNHLSITTSDDFISITADTYIIRTRRYKRIIKANNLMKVLVYRTKLTRRVNELKSDGLTIYSNQNKTVEIHANGDVRLENKFLNLRKAYANNGLQISYKFQNGLEPLKHKHSVIIAESGIANCPNAIRFNIRRDFEVIYLILTKIAKIE